MAGRRLQEYREWTNRNLFINSFDSHTELHLPSYQNQYGATAEEPEVDPWKTPPPEVEDSYQADPSNSASCTTTSQPVKKRASKEVVTSRVCADPHAGDAKQITALQAGWNVTNAIQGMFIVGLPFAVKVGGWSAVFALVWVAYVCYRTGISLIECMYEDGKKVRHSYREIAETVHVGLGKYVLVAQLTELASTCILYLVLAGDLLQGCVPSIDSSAWMMLVTAVLLSTAFLDDIRIVSHLSLANAVSHLVINAIIVLYCFSQMGDWSLRSVAFIPNMRLLPTVLGVVVFGYTSHIFLPSLEGSMQDPKEFKWMLSHSHIAAALFKATFGLIGFLTFAEFTQKEISNSLPNQLFKVIVNMVLVVKALLSYPLPYFATIQLITDNFFRGIKLTWFSSCYGADKSLREWAVCLRIILLLWTLMVALSVPFLIEFMGLIGNITGTVLSFIWPAYFHLKLKGDQLSEKEKRFNKFVIVMGVCICVVGVFFSALELRNAINSNAR